MTRRPRVAVLLADHRRPTVSHFGVEAIPEPNDRKMLAFHAALAELTDYEFTVYSRHDDLLGELRAARRDVDLVLNLADDGYMNLPHLIGHIPALLDLMSIPYTGASAEAMFLTGDKLTQLEVARAAGVPVPATRVVQPGEEPPADVAYPAIVKPSVGDGSVGITRANVVHDDEGLAAALRIVREEFAIPGPVLVQRFLGGTEASVTLLGNPLDDLRVLPVAEVRYDRMPPGAPHIASYDLKWERDHPNFGPPFRSPVSVPASAIETIEAASVRLFSRLKLRDYARIDWRLDEEGRPYLLEANGNPSWMVKDSMAQHAELAGMSYAELLASIIEAARTRDRRRREERREHARRRRVAEGASL